MPDLLMMLPIERFSLPAAFNGRDGANRARGASASQIEMEIRPVSLLRGGVNGRRGEQTGDGDAGQPIGCHPFLLPLIGEDTAGIRRSDAVMPAPSSRA
jgi:hypothetical protein